MAKIVAPNKQYDGVSAGVKFEKGVGHTEQPYLIAWFKQHGYTVEKENPEVKEPESSEEPIESADEETKKKPGRKPKHPEGE